MGRRGRRNYGDRHNKPQELVSGTDSDDFLVTSKSVYGVPDPNNPLLCSLCQKESGAALAASCGHQFCKTCVEDAVLPISACPLDNEFIRESRIAEFAFLESHDFSSSCEDNEMEILRSRVDSLTLIIDRLVEHLAIRDMINACQLAKGNRGNNQEIRGFSTRPQISDSESSDLITDASRKQIQVDHERLALSNLSVLFKMHTINDEKKGVPLVIITPDNVRQMLPRFWKTGVDEGWSDEEKIQRLRILCDSPLQRILDNSDLSRKDWPYISSLLYGEKILNELSMIRYLSTASQRQGETPHQWYLRVCEVVQRSLPPGPEQDWEIKSSFLRGLLQKYQQALGSEKYDSIGAILERCRTVDGPASKQRNVPREIKPLFNKTCYSCGRKGHVQRDCPQLVHEYSGHLWSPWEDCL